MTAFQKLHRDLASGKKGFKYSLLRAVLAPLGWIMRVLVAMRNASFDWGWCKQQRAAAPVLSIGNIAVGGTGKTPLTALLAQELSKQFQVAILSRGYHSEAEKRADPVLVSSGEGPVAAPELCGDEPYLLAKSIPQAIVIAGPKRSRSAELAVAMGAELILLDDGMQHRSLARDVDIAVIEGEDPFWGGQLLPRGRLREPPSSLSRASLIVWVLPSNCPSAPFSLESLSSAPVFPARRQITGLRKLNGEKLDLPAHTKVALASGIAQPERFKESVESLGFEVVAELSIGDHQNFSTESLQNFAEASKEKGADYLLCTEKDAVKWPSGDLPLPVGYPVLELSLDIAAILEHILLNIKNLST